ncbi:hypothetical protein [Cyanobium sp. ATX-6F1]|uniref:hypothetical protein n=1 Tax=Cyanobium sp. ATX-6F1 TaxID=3137388 RepID=UPI0039BE880C
MSYLEQQVGLARSRANASMRRAQSYALTHGLGLLDGLPASASASLPSSASGGPSNSVEGSREAAQNQVNLLRQQLLDAKASGNRVLYQAPQLAANKDLYSKLQELEARLIQKSALLQPKDELIQALQRERVGLIGYINQQTVGLVAGQLATAEAALQSLERPREIVLQHRALVSEALRDEKLLAELDGQLQALQLEKARRTNPWELISTPTLLDKPVAPKKGRNLALGLLAGLVLGSGAALVVDRRSGRVFSRDELLQQLPYPLLAELDAHSSSGWDSSLSLLAEGPLHGSRTLALVPIGDGPVQESSKDLALALQRVLQQLNPEGPSTVVTSNADLVSARHADRQLLITATGAIGREQLTKLRQQLELQGKPVAGLILLTPSRSADG